MNTFYIKNNIFDEWYDTNHTIIDFFKNNSFDEEAKKLSKVSSYDEYEKEKKNLKAIGLYKKANTKSNKSYFDGNSYFLITEFDIKNNIKETIKNDYNKKTLYLKDNKKVFENIKNDKNIFISYISPSGAGLRIIYKVDKFLKNDKEYEHNNNYYTQYFLNKYDTNNIYTIDNSKLNSNNIWFVSYTKETIHINENAKPLPKLELPKEPSKLYDNKNFKNGVLSLLKKNNNNIADSYDNFLKLAFAFKEANYTYDEVDEVFSNSIKYNYKENKKIYERLQPKSISFATAVEIAKNQSNGEYEKLLKKHNKKKKRKIEDIEEELSEELKNIEVYCDGYNGYIIDKNGLYIYKFNEAVTMLTYRFSEKLEEKEAKKLAKKLFSKAINNKIDGTTIHKSDNKIVDNKINLFDGYKYNIEEETLKEANTKYQDTYHYKLAKNLLSDKEIEYIYKYFAFTLFDNTKLPVALLLHSIPHGVGKNSFIEPFLNLISDKNISEATTETLQSSFNGFMKNSIYCIVNELEITNKTTYNSIKNYISERTININEKFVKNYQAKNTTNFIFTSNSKKPLRLQKEDRRFYVVNCKENLIDNKDFFSKYYNNIEEEEKTLYHFLYNIYQENKDNLFAYLTDTKNTYTEAKKNMLEYAYNSTENFIKDIEEQNDIYDELKEEHNNNNYISVKDLYVRYKEYCELTNQKAESKNRFSNYFCKFVSEKLNQEFISKVKKNNFNKSIRAYELDELFEIIEKEKEEKEKEKEEEYITEEEIPF